MPTQNFLKLKLRLVNNLPLTLCQETGGQTGNIYRRDVGSQTEASAGVLENIVFGTPATITEIRDMETQTAIVGSGAVQNISSSVTPVINIDSSDSTDSSDSSDSSESGESDESGESSDSSCRVT